MPMMRRRGRPGLIGTAARTAVVVGTAGAVSDHRARKSEDRYAAEQEQQAPPAAAPAAAPAGDDLTSQLERLGALRSSGVLSDEEFAAAKAKLIG